MVSEAGGQTCRVITLLHAAPAAGAEGLPEPRAGLGRGGGQLDS